MAGTFLFGGVFDFESPGDEEDGQARIDQPASWQEEKKKGDTPICEERHFLRLIFPVYIYFGSFCFFSA